MVDGINTYGSGLNPVRVVQEAAPSHKSEGGKSTDGIQERPKQNIESQLNSVRGLIQNDGERSSDFLKQAEAILNKVLTLKTANTRLSIDIDDSSGHFIYKGIDKQSGEVVSQFPAEQILSLIAFYHEKEGIVVDEKV